MIPRLEACSFTMQGRKTRPYLMLYLPIAALRTVNLSFGREYFGNNCGISVKGESAEPAPFLYSKRYCLLQYIF